MHSKKKKCNVTALPKGRLSVILVIIMENIEYNNSSVILVIIMENIEYNNSSVILVIIMENIEYNNL